MSTFIDTTEWTAWCTTCGILGVYSIESAAEVVAKRHECKEND